jgi:hypothetical protein
MHKVGKFFAAGATDEFLRNLLRSQPGGFDGLKVGL